MKIYHLEITATIIMNDDQIPDLKLSKFVNSSEEMILEHFEKNCLIDKGVRISLKEQDLLTYLK